MRDPIAYAAGPLGFSEVGQLFHKTVLIPMLNELGFEVRDPWALTPFGMIQPVLALPYGQEKKDAWRKLNRVIGRNNVLAIEECDLVVAVLDGTDVDSGTAGEIGYGAGKGKPSIGYRGDFRLAADNDGSIVNLQVEEFIYMHGGTIVTSVETLRAALIEWKDAFLQKQS